jgi:hypothetical protein
MALLPQGTAHQTLVLDTNLLVLFVTALQSHDLFERFKRVSNNFTRQDGRTLIGIVDQFGAMATNAYVIAETSNLGNSLSGFTRDLWFKTLANFSGQNTEMHVALNAAANSSIFVPLGATDAALSLLPDDYVVLTVDFNLFGHLQKQQRPVINFNHLRSF